MASKLRFTRRHRGVSHKAITSPATARTRPPGPARLLEPLECRLLLASSVGNLVWNDLNANGIQEAGEPGFAGAAIDLYDAGADGQVGGSDDVLVASAVSDAGGTYGFPSVASGTYYIQVRIPSGYSFAPKDQGGDDSVDSDVDAVGLSAVFAHTAGGDDLSQDVGVTGSTADFGWAFTPSLPFGTSTGLAIATDSAGNLYVAGSYADAADFDPGPGTAYLPNNTPDASTLFFICKLDHAGNYVWAKAFPGYVQDIAVDAAGNVYTTGYSWEADFDPGPGTATLDGDGIFVSKLDSDGNYLWAKVADGTYSQNTGTSIAVDASGNVYTTARFYDTVDFDPGPAVANLTAGTQDHPDIFLWKLDSAGNFGWAQDLGPADPYGEGALGRPVLAVDASGNVLTAGIYLNTGLVISKRDSAGSPIWTQAIVGRDDQCYYLAMAVDASGNVYTSGHFGGPLDFDPGPGTANLEYYGTFVSKLTSAGDYVWARSLDAIGDGYCDIAVDGSENVYVTGRFTGAHDFDPGPGTAILTSAGKSDIFISKLDAAGDYAWAHSIGGPANDRTYGIAVDGLGHVSTTGSFTGTMDFDPGAGVYNLTSTYSATFVSVLDSDGLIADARAIGTNLGSSTSQTSRSMATDSEGNIYITGATGSEDFDPGPGESRITSGIFLAKYTPAGALIWARSVGPTGEARGVAVDAGGNVYMTGSFQNSVDFDPGLGTATLTSAGGYDVFLLKLDSGGNYVWARAMGGTGYDMAYAIALDASGNVYTTGSFSGTADFDPGSGTANLTSAGGYDIFVSKLSSQGNYVWARAMGGTGDDIAYGIALDAFGDVYTTGNFSGTVDFDPGSGTANRTSAGGYDIFISKLTNQGNYIWARAMGSTGYDDAYGIALDASGNVYTTGRFSDTADFDPGSGTANLTSAGYYDVFISKLSSSGNYIWARSMGGTSSDIAYGIALDASGNVYTIGTFFGPADFDPGIGTVELTNYGLFISELDSAGNYVWAERIGETSGPCGYGIAVDAFGNIFTTGYFRENVDFDPSKGTLELNASDRSRAFLAKYSPSAYNAAPRPSIGGRYTIGEGHALALDASRTFDQEGDALTYAWDINGDGDFSDAARVSPTLSWAQLQALGMAPAKYYHPRVRVDDGQGNVITSAAANLTILWNGDANGDGYVKFTDYLTLEQNFGKSGKTWATGDFNGDGKVSFADYLLLEQNFGKSLTYAPSLPAELVTLAPEGFATSIDATPVAADLAVPTEMATMTVALAKSTAQTASSQTDQPFQSGQSQTTALIGWKAKAVRAAKAFKLHRLGDSSLMIDLLAIHRQM